MATHVGVGDTATDGDWQHASSRRSRKRARAKQARTPHPQQAPPPHKNTTIIATPEFPASEFHEYIMHAFKEDTDTLIPPAAMISEDAIAQDLHSFGIHLAQLNGSRAHLTTIDFVEPGVNTPPLTPLGKGFRYTARQIVYAFHPHTSKRKHRAIMKCNLLRQHGPKSPAQLALHKTMLARAPSLMPDAWKRLPGYTRYTDKGGSNVTSWTFETINEHSDQEDVQILRSTEHIYTGLNLKMIVHIHPTRTLLPNPRTATLDECKELPELNQQAPDSHQPRDEAMSQQANNAAPIQAETPPSDARPVASDATEPPLQSEPVTALDEGTMIDPTNVDDKLAPTPTREQRNVSDALTYAMVSSRADATSLHLTAKRQREYDAPLETPCTSNTARQWKRPSISTDDCNYNNHNTTPDAHHMSEDHPNVQ